MESVVWFFGILFIAIIVTALLYWLVAIADSIYVHRKSTARQRAQRKIARIEARAARAPRHRA